MQRGGSVAFSNKPGSLYPFKVACGQCVGCRLERSRQWAVRCVHEAKCHERNAYVTLTFNDENLPASGSLDYSIFQAFMRRVRKSFANRVRFYMAGEYGEKTMRPHFHALLFGADFPDRVLIRAGNLLPSYAGRSGGSTQDRSALYSSARLGELWPLGFSSVGDVTFESAAYVARYVMKKVTGPSADEHYRRVDPSTGEIVQLVPEFNRMSLKPGIGAPWLEKFHGDVFPHDRVIVRGKEAKPPKYYVSRLERVDPKGHLALKRKRRQEFFAAGRADRTPERLEVREQVARAGLANKRRKL